MYQTSSKLILIIALSTLNAQITKESFIGEWNVDKESYWHICERYIAIINTIFIYSNVLWLSTVDKFIYASVIISGLK